jgi:hypothetical protein
MCCSGMVCTGEWGRPVVNWVVGLDVIAKVCGYDGQLKRKRAMGSVVYLSPGIVEVQTLSQEQVEGPSLCRQTRNPCSSFMQPPGVLELESLW